VEHLLVPLHQLLWDQVGLSLHRGFHGSGLVDSVPAGPQAPHTVGIIIPRVSLEGASRACLLAPDGLPIDLVPAPVVRLAEDLGTPCDRKEVGLGAADEGVLVCASVEQENVGLIC